MIKAYFDPGGACAGYAIFQGDTLIKCGLSRTKLKEVGPRAAAHKDNLLKALMSVSFGWLTTPIRSEMMWHRPRKSKKGEYIPPQDLIHTNLIAGHVGTEWVYPQTWKGMVPKVTHQPKILAKLSPEELALVEAVMPPSLRHNVIDAIGIGLHDVGRLGLEAETEECRQVKQLIAHISATSKRLSTRSRTSPSSSKKRGKSRRTKPSSFISMPKGALLRSNPATALGFE